jgi:prepilin-type N-terminal cleavage/methylation domain-containing protein
MHRKTNSRDGAFTLVEIMIVVAIIALLASIAVPSFLRARKRSQATSTLETCRLLDGAKDLYAIENGKSSNCTPNWSDLTVYVKTGSNLYKSLSANTVALDVLNNTFTMNNIDKPPQVSTVTESLLSDVLPNPAAFWGSYY